MNRHFLFSSVLSLVILSASLAAPPRKQGPAGPRAASRAANSPAISGLSLRITALGTLHDLDATPEQMATLRRIAAETVEPPRRRDQPAVSAELRQVMQDLHAALIDGKDDDKIDSLQEKMDKLVDAADVDFDDDVDITDAARKRVPEVVKLFSVKQIAGLIGGSADDIEDPRERLAEALGKSRELKGDDWDDERDSAAQDAAAMVGGINATAVKSLTEKFTHWLDQAHAMSDSAFKTQFADPAHAAGVVTGEIEWSQALRNWVSYSLAELLSNPQLPAALDERLR